MNRATLAATISHTWDAEVMPSLLEYIAIPCESSAFDTDWELNGHLDRAANLLAGWAQEQLRSIEGASIDVLRPPGHTPLLFIDVPGDNRRPVLLYGHLDKQPPMEGWRAGRSAWTPTIEGDRLYGRGGADDGYALFGAVTAILALREQGLTHPPCRILIEASEESGSPDLPSYLAELSPQLGEPALVIALDASCGNYDQLWVSTSFRGLISGVLTVRTLTEGVHSGDASGVVPSPFRIAHQLLSRIENPETGEIAGEAFNAQIPEERRIQAKQVGATLGAGVYSGLPFAGATRPVASDPAELALNRAWRPQLAITAIGGLPPIAAESSVMHPDISLKLSMRLPPTIDPRAAGSALKALLEADPPYSAEVEFEIDNEYRGWHAPPLEPWLAAHLDAASQYAFSQPSAFIGGGGGIPFLSMLGERFPQAQLIATGVLGPESNAHGPNEFLHIPAAKRVVTSVACLLHDCQ